jgi:hypothetical protein
MGVKKSVFASQTEKENYQKLRRVWADKYSIYHNLPFLNIFDTLNLLDPATLRNWRFRHLKLSGQDIARLKKTSIDYTLCDTKGSPLVCIDFDGIQQGVNVGAVYHPYPLDGYADEWRQIITDLKLTVAHGSLFPYFVVSSEYFQELSHDVKLTIVDGIIGEVMSYKAIQERFSKGFEPEYVGFSQEEFDDLLPWDQHELIQNWVIAVEVEADMTHNPVTRKRWELQTMYHIRSYSSEFLSFPDFTQETSLKIRIQKFNNARRHGSRVTLHTDEHGSITETCWISNFQTLGFSGFSLAEDIAFIMAVEKLNRLKN